MNSLKAIYHARILVVDDDPINVALVKQILFEEGYQRVDSTTDPLEVRELYRRQKYDLVLLDIHMPKLSGLEVMEQLQIDNFHDYLPILVLTADNSEKIRNECLARGGKDFICKPFNRTEVLLRVRNILDVRLLHKTILQQNESLEAKVRERTQQLHQAQVKLVECLGKAVEYRDNETGMHVIRMSHAAAMLAKRLGFSDEESEMIRHASPMHDIGKIAIPDNVLLKPGILNSEEWESMKTHADVGAEILSNYDTQLMQVAAKIAKTHHEHWDGSGYPQGLRGEEIPIYGRIVTVCDVFDALTSQRPYKKPWSNSEAMDYLREHSGSEFDPEVVQGFSDIIGDVIALREKFPDMERTDYVVN